MSAGSALYELLKADAPIAAVVGSGSAARIFPGRLPQGQTLPAIRYLKIAGTHHRSLAGPVALRELVFQIDCYAATDDAAESLAKLVSDRLDGFFGVPAAGERFHAVLLEDEDATFLGPVDAGDVGRYVYSQDFRIFYVAA